MPWARTSEVRRRRRSAGPLLAAAVIAPLLPVLGLPLAPPVAAVVDPIDNPPLEQSCGLDLTLVLDASGSVSSSDAVDDVRAAAAAMMDSLANTNSRARITQFASLSEQLAPRTVVDTVSLGPGGAIRQALED